jgi:hypothetical protein
VSFDGTANINLPGVNTTGNQNTTGTAQNVVGTVAIANGGTGATTAAGAFTAIKQAATESATGVVELATTAEVAAGTDTARAVTPAGVAAHMQARALGWSQTWQQVSRTAGVVYQNTTGRPIMVAVNGNGNYTAVFVGSSSNPTIRIAYNDAPGSGQYEQYHVSFVVPDSWYYKLSGGYGTAVFELR